MKSNISSFNSMIYMPPTSSDDNSRQSFYSGTFEENVIRSCKSFKTMNNSNLYQIFLWIKTYSENRIFIKTFDKTTYGKEVNNRKSSSHPLNREPIVFSLINSRYKDLQHITNRLYWERILSNGREPPVTGIYTGYSIRKNDNVVSEYLKW